MFASSQEHSDPFRRDVAAALAHLVTNQDLLAQQQQWQTVAICNQDEKLTSLETKTEVFMNKYRDCEDRLSALEAIPKTVKRVGNTAVCVIGGLGLTLGGTLMALWGSIVGKTERHILVVAKPAILQEVKAIETKLNQRLIEVEARTDLKLHSKVDKQ